MLSLQERLAAIEEDANSAEVESVESIEDKVNWASHISLPAKPLYLNLKRFYMQEYNTCSFLNNNIECHVRHDTYVR